MDKNNLNYLNSKILLKESIESLVKKYSIGKEKKINNNNEITLKNHITDVKKYNSTYVCPITRKLMNCPVRAYDKCPYEKEAKIQYLMHCDVVKNSLKIAIFPPHSPNTLTFCTWCCIDKNDDDCNDYFARAYKQLILHLNLLTKSAFSFSSANSCVNDVDVNVKYELKYSIYNISGGKYSTISMDTISNLQNTVKITAASASRFDKYNLDSQVQNYANLKAYFQNGDSQDICYLFVECKHYFLIKNNGICYAQWHSQWSKNSVDWEAQFNCLKQDACDKCAILNDDKLSLRFGFDRELSVDDADEFELRWGDMIDNNIKTTIIVVNESDPLAMGVCDDNAEHKETEDVFIITITQSHIDTQWQQIQRHLNQHTSNIIKDKNKNTEKQMDVLVLNLFYRKPLATLAKEKELEVSQIGEDRLKSLEMLFNHSINSMTSEGYNKGTQIFHNVLNAQISLLNMRGIDSSCKEMKDVLIGVRHNKMVQWYGEAEETAKQVSNKNIILLLGHTGAAKSTTIHFLAGSHLKKHKITDNIDVIKRAPGTKVVKTTLKFIESVTRFFSGVPLKDTDVGDSQIRKGSIFLCDSSGFDDSSGAEVDAANSLGILRAVILTKHVRILLLIGVVDMGQRSQGLKKLTAT